MVTPSSLIVYEYHLIDLIMHFMNSPSVMCRVRYHSKVQQNDVHNELYFKEVSRYVDKLWLKSDIFKAIELQSRQSP